MQRFNFKQLRGLCQLCHQPLIAGESFCCQYCLAWGEGVSHCQRCGLPAEGSPASCGECITLPPMWQTLTAIGPYQFPFDVLIKRFKYQRQPWFATPLAKQLAENITQPAERLIPVPMHWKRRWQRGYNQSTVLANALGKQLNIPVDSQVITRTRHTPPQQSLNKRERFRNLRNAFKINQRSPLPHHVALVDDVVTTGTTANTLATLLKNTDVDRVDVYCLCRTPSP